MRQRGHSQSNSTSGFAPSLSNQFENSTPVFFETFFQEYLPRFRRYVSGMRFRPLQVIAAATFSFLFIWLGFSWIGGEGSHQNSVGTHDDLKSPKYDGFPDATASQILEQHGLVNMTGSSIDLARLHIIVEQDPTLTPPLMQKLELKLPQLASVGLPEEMSETGPTPVPVETTTIKIQPPDTAAYDASHILLGVATTWERLEDSLDQMSHWASNTNLRIVGSMQPSLDLEAPDRVLAKAKALNIMLGTTESGLEFLDRYFNLLILLHDNRDANTQWYGFIDDDTFFFSFRNLITALAKHSNPTNTPYYVGSISEDFRQMAQWGFMAYGGAGIFLSAALVEQLIPHYEDCATSYSTGDKKIATCIYKHTATKLTWEHGLHQIDLRGDQSGFYEALRQQPLSVHHWKSDKFGSTIDVFNMTRVSGICGEECVLQKFRFEDGWVLTNGFSLVKYSDHDARYRDLDTDISMETTWDFYGGTSQAHFEHTLAPMRESDPDKISFRSESALVEGDKRVRQLYVRRGAEGVVEAVIEITWSR